MSEPGSDRVRVCGPLAVFVGGFRSHLVERGYCPLWAQFHLGHLAQV
jgi:hypothetical protein